MSLHRDKHVAELRVLVDKRERFYQRMKAVHDYVEDLDTDEGKKVQFLARLPLLEKTYNDFDFITSRILEVNSLLDTNDQRTDALAASSNFEIMYYDCKAAAARIIPAVVVPPANVPAEENQRAMLNRPKMPAINIPTFEGDYDKFPAFKALYDALVHSQPLTNIEKYSYLRSLVSGSAASTIQGFSFSDDNYIIAYTTLVNRFTNQRVVSHHICEKLFDVASKPLSSDSQLYTFLDTFNVHVEALKNAYGGNLGDFFLLFMALRVIDPATRQAFENQRSGIQGIPLYKDLVAFIRGRVAASELLKPSSTNMPRQPQVSKPKSSKYATPAIKKSFVTNMSTPSSSPTANSCFCCSQPHRVVECAKFLALGVPARYDLLKEKKLCFACFGPHVLKECKSRFSCRTCGARSHHSLLHHDKPPSGNNPRSVASPPPKEPVQSPGTSGSHQVYSAVAQNQVLLGTAQVRIRDAYNVEHLVRVLIDPGSMLTIMTSSLARRLALPQEACNIHLSGIGGGEPQKASGSLKCQLTSHYNRVSLDVDVVILPKISSNIPSIPVATHVVQRLSGVQLADPAFFKPSPVDLLLGAQYYAAILDTSKPIVHGEPSLIPSIFGALVMGITPSPAEPITHQTYHVSSVDPELSLELQLKKFWEMEEVPVKIPSNPEDIQCEQHFQRTHYRDSDGSYVVRLPFRDDKAPDLGSNLVNAKARLLKLERVLEHKPEFKSLYHENLVDYLNQGHMIVAPNPSSYVLIHHGVMKASSTTTKVRVVFSPAERATPNHPSLNETLLVGPKLQHDINNILLNFRLHRVVLTADIKQMYRAIKLHPDDSKYQQLLWRSDTSEPIQQYEIQRVCFGVACAPFQAQRVIKQLVDDEGHRFPRAAPVLKDDIYIDDVVTGADSVEEARLLRDELSSLFSAGGFELRKWSSSHPSVLKDVPVDLLEKPHSMGDDSDTLKILGIQWDSKEDAFSYHVNPIDTCITKRQVLSQIARIFDLPGFLGPITIWMKIMMQRLWLKGLGWDHPLPDDLLNDWSSFVAELPCLRTIKIPRYVMDTYVYPPELVGFADASSIAMSAVVYLRVVCTDQRVLINLIRAKTRVAPVKPVTIPRLELTACNLLASVIESLSPLQNRLNIQTLHLFSDSMVVLTWLKTPPHLLKTFVANRVVNILESTSPQQWNHIATELNPADLGSRGCYPTQLIDDKLWWYGPEFLQNDPTTWPHNDIIQIEDLPELKQAPLVANTVTVNGESIQLLETFSSFTRAQRVIAWCLRFRHNCLARSTRQVGPLSVEGLRYAEICMIRITQAFYYANVFHSLERHHPLPSSLASLSPFVLEQCLRVGGRIDKSPLPYDSRHPFLLPAKSHLALLLVRYYHKLSLHGGPRIVQHLVQTKYFIPGLRNLTRKTIFQCVPCYRLNAKPKQPYMAELPPSRFQQGRPFIHVGVDLAGPFSLKSGIRRNAPIIKSYFAVFVCFSVKAIHLEALTSLSTECFLASFDRFVARRGLPQVVFSDQGSNFKGAARVLDETFHFLKANDLAIADHLSKLEIQWSFNAPANPSAGGLWEAGVKSVKTHLKHLLTDLPLQLEEFHTVLCRIEAILNSRPLGVPSSLPVDGIECLTPGHFLIGAPMLARPERDFTDLPENRIPRWDVISRVSRSFWKRWCREYLHTLIQRQKWLSPTLSPKVGDIVIITSENCPPLKWPLARVMEVLPAHDGVVRIVSLKTSTGSLVRPVRKLLILPSCQ